VAGYGLNDWGSIPGTALSLHCCLQAGSVAHPASHPWEGLPDALSLEVNQPERETDLMPPSSAEVKNAWSYTSTQSPGNSGFGDGAFRTLASCKIIFPALVKQAYGIMLTSICGPAAVGGPPIDKRRVEKMIRALRPSCNPLNYTASATLRSAGFLSPITLHL
jgi:hypothetical protein